MARNKFFKSVSSKAESFVTSVMQKYAMGAFGRSVRRPEGGQQPIYERQFSPYWIKAIAEQQSLVNNSIEEKVQQSFRRGFEDWEKVYEAKCPHCHKEFKTLEPFKDQLGSDGDDLDDSDIDFDQPRVCPKCGELSYMKVPDPVDREKAQKFFREANMFEYDDALVPDNRETSISQSFLQVCKEVAWDIQMFDDGWMVFERTYTVDEDGNVLDFEFDGVTRAPPYLMRYSTNEGDLGKEWWVCLECRAKQDGYMPQKSPGECKHCDNRTYEVFAYMQDGVKGDPIEFFINGEFAHDSEYRPTRLYGLSPIVSLADETRSLQNMDEWYRIAYERRRAPRGAIVIRSSNSDSMRSWNQEQLAKLNSDPQHIPTMMDDTDGGGNPISWQPLLDDPADMQHMQMREWILDRISAKFGVTAVFQNASAQSTGLSQSLEVVVSNRSAERLQNVFEDTFIPTFIGQIGADGWERHLKTPEEEDEQALAQLKGKELQNLRTANDLGMEAEWTRNDRADIKPQKVEPPEDDDDDGGLGGLFGSDPTPSESRLSGSDSSSDESGGGNNSSGDSRYSNPSERPTTEEDGVDASGTTSTSGGRPNDPNEMGGGPSEPDTPTSDDPYRRSDEKTVTSGTSGYSSAAYGGKPAKVIDVLEQIRETEDPEERAEKARRVRQLYNECCEAVDGDIPSFEEIERSIKSRPDKDYRAFKRNHSGAWCARMDTEQFVKQVYEFAEREY